MEHPEVSHAPHPASLARLTCSCAVITPPQSQRRLSVVLEPVLDRIAGPSRRLQRADNGQLLRVRQHHLSYISERCHLFDCCQTGRRPRRREERQRRVVEPGARFFFSLRRERRLKLRRQRGEVALALLLDE
eukprot:371959-Prymnesium_polylepis.1